VLHCACIIFDEESDARCPFQGSHIAGLGFGCREIKLPRIEGAPFALCRRGCTHAFAVFVPWGSHYASRMGTQIHTVSLTEEYELPSLFARMWDKTQT
jgi:hypothetical protein